MVERPLPCALSRTGFVPGLAYAMKLKQIRIRNFRSLTDVTLPLDGTTVLLGENNVGKSAVVDALRHLLSRAAARPSALFDEYDFHLKDELANPRTSDGIIIDATFEEDQPDEWPDAVTQELNDIIQTDPTLDIDSIHLRVSSKFEPASKSFKTLLEFLSIDGKPLGGKARSPNNFQSLLRYVPLFHLSALRDVTDEFTGRSQFWGRILRSLDVPEDKVAEIHQRMEALNQELMTVDARLERVTQTLGRAGDVVSTSSGDRVAIRALPLKIWDLMSRAEIVFRGKGSNVTFPLTRHGQGLQSLAVLFLFEAFVDHLLAVVYEKVSTPVLTLEEPEAHLHPQAARALWEQVKRLPGQKLVTTHSPYFAQLVPIRSLRLLRRRGAATTAHWLPTSVEGPIPASPELLGLVSNNKDLYEYRKPTGVLVIKRRLSENDWRALLRCYSDAALHPQLRDLQRRAAALLSNEELRSLEIYARRTRGEIFFARCWLLCEGQSEVAILPRLAEMMGISLDALGIALIDYKNNGSPGAFAALARALDFPWFMFCDDDDGGRDHIREIEKYGFLPEEVNMRIRKLPGTDLEGFLTRQFPRELHEAATRLGARFVLPPEDPTFAESELVPFLRRQKTGSAALLADALHGAGAEKVPDFFKEILTRCLEVANA